MSRLWLRPAGTDLNRAQHCLLISEKRTSRSARCMHLGCHRTATKVRHFPRPRKLFPERICHVVVCDWRSASGTMPEEMITVKNSCLERFNFVTEVFFFLLTGIVCGLINLRITNYGFGAGYYSHRNQFERFRGVLELISRFEFDFRRRGNFFLNDSNFWCVQSSTTCNETVHVHVLWPVCTHTIPFRMLRCL